MDSGGDSSLNTMAHGTYPRATRLQDGSILGVHTAFQGGTNIIAVVRSTDNGLTWSPVGEVCLTSAKWSCYNTTNWNHR
jgi:hypothetical protein